MNNYLINQKITLKSTLNEVLKYENNLVDLLSQIDSYTEKFVFDIRLAFHEAIINIIIHTYEKDPDNDIDIELKANEESVEIIIRDYGSPVDTKTIKSRDLNDLKNHGLGVYFYRTLMDKVEYIKPKNNNGNIIKLVKIISS